MTTVVGATIFGPVHDNGTFTPASAVPAAPAALTDAADLTTPAFPTVRRGYDPVAVDAHLALLMESVSALHTALAGSERRRAMAEEHALAVEEEIRIVRSAPAEASDGSFGARAERMLRLVETEAEQIRSTAHRTAAEVADQQLAQARADADAVRMAAERAAEAHRAGAQADVDELRRRTANELAMARAQGERELRRLRDLQAHARVELARLAAAIRAELAPQAIARPSPHPARRTEAAPAKDPGPGLSDDTTDRFAGAFAAR